MIVPNGKLSIIQILLNLRETRRKRLLLNNAVAKFFQVGMKYNMNKITYQDINGVFKTLVPQDKFWFNTYVKIPNVSNRKFQIKFILRFRVPRSTFVDLHKAIKYHELFSNGIIHVLFAIAKIKHQYLYLFWEH